MSQQLGITLQQPMVQRLLTGGFFAAIFLVFSKPLWLVSDFWWHLNTGRWIWENGRLPTLDPFLFSSGTDLTLRQDLILQGYWLAQLLYYQVWQLSGFFGIVLLKAATLTAIYWLVFRAMVKRGVDHAFALFLLGPLVLLAAMFEEPRPQVFSFLGAVLVVCLLEGERHAGGKPQAREVRWLYALPLVMGVWANLHPGYLIGLLLIGVYALRLLIEMRIKGDPDRSHIRTLLVYLVGAGACFLNPMGTAAIEVTLADGLAKTAEHIRFTNEYLPLWKFLILYSTPLLLGLYVFVTLLLGFALFYRWRRQDWFVALLFLLFLGLGLFSYRYSFFFVVLMPVLLADKLRVLVGEGPPRMRLVWLVGMVLCLAVFSRQAGGSVLFGAPPQDTAQLDHVVARLEKLPPGTRIFNPYEWGGYLGWRLNQRHALFIDARAFDAGVYADYRRIAVSGDYGVLQNGEADCVVYYLERFKWEPIPDIVFSLLGGDDWRCDQLEGEAVFFTRTGNGTTGAREANRAAVERLISRYSTRLATGERPLLAHKSLGRLYLLRGEPELARLQFRAALELQPDDEYAGLWLAKLTSNATL